MEGLKRCPKCFKQPLPKIENNGTQFTIILECAAHGHMAMGDSVEGVTQNWNQYIDLIQAGVA
jgi:hypothetical protein